MRPTRSRQPGHFALRRPWFWFGLWHGTLTAIALAMCLGCSRTPETIQSYEVVRRTQPAQPEGTDRLLGAVIPVGGTGWFFKVSGSADEVSRIEEGFEALVRSVRAGESGGGGLSWTLPEGWRELPGDGMRAATFVAPEASGLEVTLTSLPIPAGDLDAYVMQNVNRWRGQISLPAVAQIDMPTTVEQFELDGLTVTWVDLKGQLVTGR